MIINQPKITESLKKLSVQNEFNEIKEGIKELKNNLKGFKTDKLGLLNIVSNGQTININSKYLENELDQIINTQTLERIKYYVNRLLKGLTEKKTNKINDINLYRWKEYTDIITDSLWILDKRDTSGAHLGWYWGNFIPQIPHQLMLRYTKKGEWVLDPFAGSGTTLIECKRLGRNGLGVELNPYVGKRAKELIKKEGNLYEVVTEVITHDARTVDLKKHLDKYGIEKVQLMIMHPPYHDIIKFSKSKEDLSCAPDVETFVKMFGEVLDNTDPFLEIGRYLGIVIGDKYSKGEWIPLGFHIMQEVLKRNYLLKSIIVKNFEETRAKRNQKELWKYRALVGGFYIFKHEYILLFKKRGT